MPTPAVDEATLQIQKKKTYRALVCLAHPQKKDQIA